MQIRKIYKGLYHTKFLTQYELTSTYMRVQEYYESNIQGIRGTFFTLEEFMDAYAKFKGNFTYCIDWSGFNVPGKVAKEFFTKADLLEKEKKFWKRIGKRVNIDKPFYLIGTHGVKADLDDVRHEIAHGLYYLNEDYRHDMHALVGGYEDIVRLKKLLLEMGYCNEVIEDEVQAYLATNTKKTLKQQIKGSEICSVPRRFKYAFDHYIKECKIKVE